MNLTEILERRHKELGKKPESFWVRHFAYTDWGWVMFCSVLVLAFVAYLISVLLSVLVK